MAERWGTSRDRMHATGRKRFPVMDRAVPGDSAFLLAVCPRRPGGLRMVRGRLHLALKAAAGSDEGPVQVARTLEDRNIDASGQERMHAFAQYYCEINIFVTRAPKEPKPSKPLKQPKKVLEEFSGLVTE
eukprot:scaffold733_cov267-Pinguiococcus_pyrenoidosus.AAC.46